MGQKILEEGAGEGGDCSAKSWGNFFITNLIVIEGSIEIMAEMYFVVSIVLESTLGFSPGLSSVFSKQVGVERVWKFGSTDIILFSTVGKRLIKRKDHALEKIAQFLARAVFCVSQDPVKTKARAGFLQ